MAFFVPFLFLFNLSESLLLLLCGKGAGGREGEPPGRALSGSPWQIENTNNKF